MLWNFLYGETKTKRVEILTEWYDNEWYQGANCPKKHDSAEIAEKWFLFHLKPEEHDKMDKN